MCEKPRGVAVNKGVKAFLATLGCLNSCGVHHQKSASTQHTHKSLLLFNNDIMTTTIMIAHSHVLARFTNSRCPITRSVRGNHNLHPLQIVTCV